MAALTHSTPARRALLTAALAVPTLPISSVAATAKRSDDHLIQACSAYVAFDGEERAICDHYADLKGVWSYTPAHQARLEYLAAKCSSLLKCISRTQACTFQGVAAKARVWQTMHNEPDDDELLVWRMCDEVIQLASLA